MIKHHTLEFSETGMKGRSDTGLCNEYNITGTNASPLWVCLSPSVATCYQQMRCNTVLLHRSKIVFSECFKNIEIFHSLLGCPSSIKLFLIAFSGQVEHWNSGADPGFLEWGAGEEVWKAVLLCTKTLRIRDVQACNAFFLFMRFYGPDLYDPPSPPPLPGLFHSCAIIVQSCHSLQLKM